MMAILRTNQHKLEKLEATRHNGDGSAASKAGGAREQAEHVVPRLVAIVRLAEEQRKWEDQGIEMRAKMLGLKTRNMEIFLYVTVRTLTFLVRSCMIALDMMSMQ